MVYGIPLSADDTVEHEHKKIVYFFRPCIGSIERQIGLINSKIFDVSACTGDAAKAVDAENVGRVWKPGDRVKEILTRAAKIAEDNFALNYNAVTEAQKRDEIFDIICKGWKGECAELKEGVKPSDFLRAKDKQKLVEWYLQTQMRLSGEEEKN